MISFHTRSCPFAKHEQYPDKALAKKKTTLCLCRDLMRRPPFPDCNFLGECVRCHGFSPSLRDARAVFLGDVDHDPNVSYFLCADKGSLRKSSATILVQSFSAYSDKEPSWGSPRFVDSITAWSAFAAVDNHDDEPCVDFEYVMCLDRFISHLHPRPRPYLQFSVKIVLAVDKKEETTFSVRGVPVETGEEVFPPAHPEVSVKRLKPWGAHEGVVEFQDAAALYFEHEDADTCGRFGVPEVRVQDFGCGGGGKDYAPRILARSRVLPTERGFVVDLSECRLKQGRPKWVRDTEFVSGRKKFEFYFPGADAVAEYGSYWDLDRDRDRHLWAEPAVHMSVYALTRAADQVKYEFSMIPWGY